MENISGQGFCVQQHPDLVVLEEKGVLKVWEFPAQFSIDSAEAMALFLGAQLPICSNKGDKGCGLIPDCQVLSTSQIWGGTTQGALGTFIPTPSPQTRQEGFGHTNGDLSTDQNMNGIRDKSIRARVW